MLVTVFPIMLTDVHYLLTLASGTIIQKMSSRVAIQSPTSTNRQQVYVTIIPVTNAAVQSGASVTCGVWFETVMGRIDKLETKVSWKWKASSSSK